MVSRGDKFPWNFQRLIMFRPLSRRRNWLCADDWWLLVYSEIYLRFVEHRRFSNRVNDSMAARSINCSLENNWKRGERRDWPTAGVTAGKKARITGANFESSTIRLIANLRNGDASYTAMRAKSNLTEHQAVGMFAFQILRCYDIEISEKGNETKRNPAWTILQL